MPNIDWNGDFWELNLEGSLEIVNNKLQGRLFFWK